MTVPLHRLYVPDRFAYRRRPSRAVMVGPVRLGGGFPIVVQSMCTTPTQDVAATVRQCVSLAEAGCQIIRITAPGLKDAQALRDIRRDFSAAGFAAVPLVADIHFMPAAALEAVEHVEKVRVNPGNYADRKGSAAESYTAAEYRAELERIAERFRPLVRRARELGRALRIGTNHGSLSERIVNRFGDTPAGMVESAMEFILIAEAEGFHELVISMKSSRPTVMVQAYRLLCARLASHGEEYPLHLGVTEAGDGEDGRAKGAAGIGALLEDGIGDTIRVSLTEPPEAEIPVALALARRYEEMRERAAPPGCPTETIDPYSFRRRVGAPTRLGAVTLGGDQAPLVLVPSSAPGPAGKEPPADATMVEGGRSGMVPLVRIPMVADPPAIRPGTLVLIDLPGDDPARRLRDLLPRLPEGVAVGIADPGSLGETRAYRLLAAVVDGADRCRPICLALTRQNDPLAIAAIAGGLLVDGLGDAVFFPAAADPRRTAFTVLQALRARLTRADYVACPSCGRTLFDLMAVTAHIKEATGHLDGVTIAIMGCIVNGPGEMADADFGFVGSGPGKVDLYRGREKVRHGIPFATARDELVRLIKEAGRWREPEQISPDFAYRLAMPATTAVRIDPAWDTPATRAACGGLAATLVTTLATLPESAVIHRGRNTLFRLTMADTEVVAKVFPPRHGWRRLVRRGCKANQALDHAARLRDLGLGTPAPYAALQFADGSACYICAWIPGCRRVWELHDGLLPDGDRHCAELGAFVARMHLAGVLHRDNTPGNILLKPAGDRFDQLVVDTNRMRFGRVGRCVGLASLVQLECQDRLLDAYCRVRGWSGRLPRLLFRCHRLVHRVKWWLKDGTRPLRRKLGF